MNQISIPHLEILQLQPHDLEVMSIHTKMGFIQNIRNFIGLLKDKWVSEGYTGESVPQGEKDALEKAEKIGLIIFEGMGFPADYWENCKQELERAKKTIEQDAEIKSAYQTWGALSLEDKRKILQKAVSILAQEQSALSPIRIKAGNIEWRHNVPYEGNAPSDYRDSPDTYQIELNGDEPCGLASDFDRVLKCALHEQIHVKHINVAHAYYVDQLPMTFNNVAIYFTLQSESYIPPFRSENLWSAQLGEREALMANELHFSFE